MNHPLRRALGRLSSANGGSSRVLVVTPVYPPARGGIETLTYGIVDGLGEQVIEVVTLEEQETGESLGQHPPVRRAPNIPRGGRRSMIRLNLLLVLRGLRLRPTAVLSMHVRCAVGCQILQKLTGVRWVQYYHAKEIPIFDQSAVRAARCADVHVAVSSYTADLVRQAGARPERVYVIPPAAPPGLAALAPAGRPEHPDEGDSPRRTVLTVSRMADEYKGHDIMLAALPRIAEVVPDVRWVVAGDGILREPIARRAAEAGLTDRVELRGAVSDSERDELLRTSDVFVLPSRVPEGGKGGEGFGIVYIEAAAAGLPVVAGNRGGSVDAVEDADRTEDGGTGLLVDATSPDAVADAVIRLLTDQSLAGRLRERGPHWAATFTWDRLLADLTPLL